MKAKIFEIRDHATFIPVLAVQLGSDDRQERYLLGRAGYGLTPGEQRAYVMLSRIDGGLGKCTTDPFDWPQDPRTIHVAHRHITAHFDELKPGAVVDVAYILGETKAEKVSEREWTDGEGENDMERARR